MKSTIQKVLENGRNNLNQLNDISSNEVYKKKLVSQTTKFKTTHPGPMLYIDAIARKENQENATKTKKIVTTKISLSKASEIYAIQAFLKDWEEAIAEITTNSILCHNEDILGFFNIFLTQAEIKELKLDFKSNCDDFKEQIMKLIFSESRNVLKTKWASRRKSVVLKDEYTYKPKISRKSTLLARNQGSTHERITSPKRKSLITIETEPVETVPKFSPSKTFIDPIKKSQTLFEDGLKKALKTDKDTEEIEWERNRAECSFHPTIPKRLTGESSVKDSEMSPVYSYTRGESKYFERMKAARVSKFILEELKQKGVAPSEKLLRNLKVLAEANEPLVRLSVHDIISRNESTTERQPILAVDVNIDEFNSDKLVIFENDDPYLLACEFANKHKLSEEMKDKLIALLRIQMNSLLSKIEEEDEN